MAISLTGSLNISGSNTLIGTKTITGSVFISGSKTIIGNNIVTGSMLISGSINTNGTITATTLVVQTITSSISSITGSTNFGSLSSNTHVFTGSMYVTGAFYVASGSVGINQLIPSSSLDVRVLGESPATGKIALIAGTSNGANDIFRWYDGSTQLGVFKNNGVVAIGTTNTSTEANLYLGAKTTDEGGQLILQKGTNYTSASHLDNYQNRFRIMRGNDTGSTGETFSIDMTTGVVELPFGQLKFPVTQNPSSDTNTLDDYEEGTWTPVIGGSTSQSGQSYSGQAGLYTKIGRQVFVTFRVALSAKGTITGDAVIKGLPFTAEGTSFSFGSGATYFEALATSWNSIYFMVTGGQTYASIDGTKTAGVAAIRATGADIGNNTQFNGSFTYFV